MMPVGSLLKQKREAIAGEQERLPQYVVNPHNLAVADALRVLGKPVEHEYSLHELFGAARCELCQSDEFA